MTIHNPKMKCVIFADSLTDIV